MTANELKTYIIDNTKIEDVINDLGCHGFKEYTNEYRCGLPNHNSKNNVAINKETLSIKIFISESETIRGDIFTLIIHIKNISFPKANKYLHELFGFEYKYKPQTKKKEKIDPLDIFKRVKKRRYIVNKEDIEIYDEDIIKEYIPLVHINWVRDGILPFAAEKFGVGYSLEKKRITIPWRYWSGEENDIVGVMGRSILTAEQCDMLDIPKYFPLKSFPKSLHIYGLQENYETIQREGYIIIAEAEKSTLKRYSRKDGTVVAIGGHDILDEQVKILIGLNVEIVIGFDSDVSLQHVRMTCEKFYGIRPVSYIFNKYDIMKEKQAPMDLSDKLYRYLFKYRMVYDEKEHNEYLKGLK